MSEGEFQQTPRRKEKKLPSMTVGFGTVVTGFALEKDLVIVDPLWEGSPDVILAQIFSDADRQESIGSVGTLPAHEFEKKKKAGKWPLEKIVRGFTNGCPPETAGLLIEAAKQAASKPDRIISWNPKTPRY